jgi:hypothetical protein
MLTSKMLTQSIARHAASLRPTALPALMLGAAALAGCVDQPKPICISTTNPFAVKLITVDGPVESAPGACMGFGPDTFNALPEIGLSPYYPQGSDGQPDYERGSLAVQTAEIGNYLYTAEGFEVGNAVDGTIYSFGAFNSAKPGDDDLCHVPELTPTRLVLPELAAIPDDPATEDDTPFPGQPAVDATLAWSNVSVYVTADSFGTQMAGDLVDTRINAAGESCTFTYRALGLAPAVACGATNEMGAPLFNEDGSPVLAPELCDPEADPANGRPIGSGIGPSARYECDPITAFCVVQGTEIPALR